MAAKYGQDESAWPLMDEDAYLQAMGPPRGTRFYGIGSSGVGASTFPRRSDVASTSHSTFQASRCRTSTPESTSRATLADMQREMEALAAAQRDYVLQRAALTGEMPSAEDIRRAMHDALETQMAAMRTSLDTHIDERMDRIDAARRADLDEIRAQRLTDMSALEAQRKKDEEERREHDRRLEEQRQEDRRQDSRRFDSIERLIRDGFANIRSGGSSSEPGAGSGKEPDVS